MTPSPGCFIRCINVALKPSAQVSGRRRSSPHSRCTSPTSAISRSEPTSSVASSAIHPVHAPERSPRRISRTARPRPWHQNAPRSQLMSPYGDRFGGARLIRSDCALDRIASSVRPSFTLMTPTGVFLSASSRSSCTWSSVHPQPLFELVSGMACSSPGRLVAASSPGNRPSRTDQRRSAVHPLRAWQSGMHVWSLRVTSPPDGPARTVPGRRRQGRRTGGAGLQRGPDQARPGRDLPPAGRRAEGRRRCPAAAAVQVGVFTELALPRPGQRPVDSAK
jgi:hypothetical protein